MKVVFDNIIYYLQKSGGGSVYWTELVRRADDCAQMQAVFAEPKGNADNMLRRKLCFKTILKETKYPATLLRFADFTIKIEEKYLFHSGYYRISTAKNARNITTIYDFIPEKYFTGLRKWYNIRRKRRALSYSSGVICISESTKRDLMQYYPNIPENKIKVIHNGVSEVFRKLDEKYDKLSFQYSEILKKYVLYVGHRTSYYKNFHVAAEAVSLMDKKYHFVIVGQPLIDAEQKLLNELLPDRHTLISGLDSEGLNVLFNFAHCFVYPTSYEGFGIPVLEAMRAGCPVVTTNRSSIPEVAGNAAIMVKHIEPPEFAHEMKALENRHACAKVQDLGFRHSKMFSWDKSFNETLEFYKQISSQKQ